MVGLNPSRFYGRLLPRPRIYCDVKFSDARVDPPESVNAAFLEWAGDASWKMGGTAAKRKRMSGKIEGRMSKLRAMDESDEDEEPAVKKVVEKKTLGFGKNESPASVLPKHMTPIERMLETPGTKRGKLAPRRIMSSPGDGERQQPVAKPKARKLRKEQVIEESDEDSDDDLEGFMQRIEENKLTPNRRKSARLQGSPSQTPDSKKRTPKSSPERAPFVDPTSLPSPVPHKRKRGDEDSGSESDSPSEDSDSVYL
jgi:hypothetical protein